MTVPVTIEDVCRWADAFDANNEAEAQAVPGEPSFEHALSVSEGTFLSRWEAHRSVADICRLVRDTVAADPKPYTTEQLMRIIYWLGSNCIFAGVFLPEDVEECVIWAYGIHSEKPK